MAKNPDENAFDIDPQEVLCLSQVKYVISWCVKSAYCVKQQFALPIKANEYHKDLHCSSSLRESGQPFRFCWFMGIHAMGALNDISCRGNC